MQKARAFQEEKGLNALYLAFGFLNWKEKGTTGQQLRSPLVLLPTKLSREDLFSPYTLSSLDEEITTNNSLEQKLFNDFGVELPKLTENTNLDDYLNRVKRIVEPLNWTIETHATQLGLFSFTKINMYHDIERNHDKIATHHIIRAINGEEATTLPPIPDLKHHIHDSIDPQDVFSVVDADSSQQDAIMLAKSGVSFVLQGPPGTGKSQTITNIIAELIANDKRFYLFPKRCQR